MTPLSKPIPHWPNLLPHAICEQGEWLERCCASILQREPFLAYDDILDLAGDLWDRPACQVVAPELAAGLLFSDQLRCLNCPLRGTVDFSVLCLRVQTDRCPPSRAVLHL
jgi:hypothetical protein